MKIIRVEALRREGHSYRACAQRFFPSGEPVELEVLDQEADFEGIGADGNVVYDPATTIEVDVTNSTTGRAQKAKRPHPTRIGQKAYREIIADPVLSRHEGGAISAELSQAALDAARKQASDLAGELVDAMAKLAAASERATQLEEALAAAGAEIAELKAKAGSGDHVVKPAETTETQPDKGGKAGKGK